MKRCAQCHGKLGLGVRSRNLWNGRWWIHVRYCSTHCEALHEVERRQRQTSLAHTFLSRSSSTELNDAVVTTTSGHRFVAARCPHGSDEQMFGAE
jgi:hypothetical protein